MNKPNPRLVMQFFEEPEHLRIVINYPQPIGAKTMWLAKADATLAMNFIGQRATTLKPEEIYERRVRA
jgi:hypothetical protein